MDNSEFFINTVMANTYTELKHLSKSGFNELYTVEREGKRFCVKALNEEYRGNPLYESLLRKEFEIGYLLEHTHICQTYSFDKFDDLGNVIIMEWIDGRTLDCYIEEGHNIEECKRLALQLCEAISYAHKKQTIHRDLKPQNIIVTNNGDNIKLLDFGLSDTDQHTMLKEPAGSRRYASPELLSGGSIDSRSDIYSFGIIISELFKDIKSRKIKKIVTRSTALSPDARYSSAGQIATELNSKSAKTKNFIYITLILILAGYMLYTSQKENKTVAPSNEVELIAMESSEQIEDIETTTPTDSSKVEIPAIEEETATKKADVTTKENQETIQPKEGDAAAITPTVSNEVIIPSAELDNVSQEEFDRRLALSNEFYKSIFDNYNNLIFNTIFQINCLTPEIPDFEKLKDDQLSLDNELLESMLGEISNSSLYVVAGRSITLLNDDKFNYIGDQFPKKFWWKSREIYNQSTDSLAVELRKEFRSPKQDPNYADLSWEEQQADDERYKNALQEYNKETVLKWVIAYRQKNNLAPLPKELLDYFEHNFL